MEAVKVAIDAGYRHFDTAFAYNNEGDVGTAVRAKIAEGVIKRQDVFVVTKVSCHQFRIEFNSSASNKLNKYYYSFGIRLIIGG